MTSSALASVWRAQQIATLWRETETGALGREPHQGGRLMIIDPAPTITAMLNATPSNPPIPRNPQPIEQVPVHRDAPRPARG